MKNEGKKLAEILNVKVKLGENKMKLIPRAGDVIYRIIKKPVADEDNPDDDETFMTRTLQTVFVEGTHLTPDRKAVNVNGQFEISLEDEDEQKRYSDDRIFAEEEEAIHVWEHNTKLELERAKKLQDKMNHIVNHLNTNLEEKQY